MKQSTIILAILAVVMLLVGFVAGFYYNDYLYQQSALEETKTLIIGTTKTLRLLDGSAISNDVEVVMGSQIFETLMRDNPDTGELEILLAAEWPTVSSDGLTYTVKLKENIKMTDGVELTANLVKWSWATSFAEPETLSLIGGYFLDPTEEDPAGQIEVVDKYTVKFHLAFPFAPFIKVLASPAMCIYSDQHWDRAKDEYVGSGPWKFVHWIRDEEVLLERNDDYWMEEEKPTLEKMVWRFFKSPTSLGLALREGAIDIAWRQLTTTDMGLFMDEPEYTVVKAPGVRVAGLTINCAPEFAPLDDKRVRQAINWCIDRDEIIEKAYGGFGLSKIYSICPEDYPGYSPVMEMYTPRNIDKAKQLLAEAGHPNGFETDFWISSHQYGEPMKAAALLVKDQCADAGITINILDMEFAQWLTTRKQGVCPISTTHWSGDYFDSYAYIFNFLSSTGDSETPEYQYSNPAADELLMQAAVEPNEATRNAMYLQLQQIAAEDAMVVLYGTLAEDAVIRSNVHGFHMPPDYMATRFHQVTKTLE